MKSGFSLVELSIVLVILGLLTGGILAGQNLIRAAELRSVTTEYSNFQTAVMTFRDKYFALPGDMRNAFDFWGAAIGCTDVDVATDEDGCNGNGDGTWRWGQTEGVRAWQHLQYAGLIEGSFTGLFNTDLLAGVNHPKARAVNGCWQMHYWPVNGTANRANGYSLGTDIGTLDCGIGSAFSPEEAWNIDTKIDDGKPQSGRMDGNHGFVTSAPTFGVCFTGTGETAEYDLLRSGAQCRLVIQQP